MLRRRRQGIAEVAAYGDADTVVTGIVGCAGLLPTIEAIKAGKDIALANKETLISGGSERERGERERGEWERRFPLGIVRAEATLER